MAMRRPWNKGQLKAMFARMAVMRTPVNTTGIREFSGNVAAKFMQSFTPRGIICKPNIQNRGSVKLHYTDSAGHELGYFSSSWDAESGNLHIESVFMDKQAQGTAIANNAVAAAILYAKRCGFKEVTLFANGGDTTPYGKRCSVGQYAWAIQGFDYDDFTGTGVGSRKAGQFETYLRVKGIEFQPGQFKHSWDVAKFTTMNDKGDIIKIGKDYMLYQGDSYNGVIKLTPGHPSYDRWMDYTRMRWQKSGAKKRPPMDYPEPLNLKDKHPELDPANAARQKENEEYLSSLVNPVYTASERLSKRLSEARSGVAERRRLRGRKYQIQGTQI